LGLIYALGYGASAWIVGRRILRQRPNTSHDR
jgi:hypothetical protein